MNMVDSCVINITDNAKQHIKKLQKKDKNIVIYIGVIGGGCSGLQYDIREGRINDYANTTNLQPANDAVLGDDDWEDEIVKEKRYVHIKDSDGLPMVVLSEEAVKYVEGSSVDFLVDPFDGGFRILNPKATARCGCGISFST